MPISARHLLASLLAVAAIASILPQTASAEVLRHRATGFVAKAPADFSARFQRASISYVIVSSRRRAAIAYQRVRSAGSPQAVGRVLVARAGSAAVRERAGRRAYRALLRDGRVLRVRRTRGRILNVTRFVRRDWRGPRLKVLNQIRRSIRGGRVVPLPVDPHEPTGPREDRPRPRADRSDDRPADPTTGVPSAPGEILFRSDFELGDFTGWYVQSLEERATVFAGGAFGSGHAARFEVRDGDVEPDTGDERSEVSLSRPRFDEGQELFFRDTIRVPRGSSIGSSYQIIQQLHEEDWDGSPGVAVFLKPGPSIEIGSGDGDRTFLDTTPIQYDRWHDLVYRVKLSRDPAVGFMEVWLDGVPQQLDNGQTRIYGMTIQAARTYLKAGIYRGRSHTGTSVVEHDNLTVGTTFAAVTGG
ncbi:MAG TPA: heparin lyase I family protein [Thermoleophilaceae bacterium]|nr:heparin lyase I family protein [Thermoleophilaceae bacterium]